MKLFEEGGQGKTLAAIAVVSIPVAVLVWGVMKVGGRLLQNLPPETDEERLERMERTVAAARMAV